MKTTITALILFISPVFSQNDILSGKSSQRAALNNAMDAAGIGRFKCVSGYLGLDCLITGDVNISKLSCYLKGKPGKSQGGIFMSSDQENKGYKCYTTTVAPTKPTASTAYTTSTTSTTSTAYITPTTSTKTTTPTTPAVYTTPTMPAARAACPLIVDIQKCMNKCVDDVLN
ncbi:hypothetical protein BB560_004146 [Smittium megazygosporum]|uniref:Hydrophobin n=1 Tax=Smittium megazygosporum TaxID=133381 RepID=A0A2T9ZA35_9FUNG|nr:hypothetical protein BB560_004146 [Smittium megazygosporum]